MKSPFPGMDPYLENPDLWPEVHSRLIVAIADILIDQLSEKYRIAIEKRTYFSNDEESLLVGLPDVSILSSQQSDRQPTATATLTSPVEPKTITLPAIEEVQERYLEIREVATGSVITTLEILSPKNKRSGTGRQAYQQKRDRILTSLTHLVEIDLLRGGKPWFVTEERTDYRVLISRSNSRPRAQLYAFTIRQSLPQFYIPLIEPAEEPILDLQAVFQQVYRRGRYHLAVDYCRSPQPTLPRGDREWIEELLREKEKGSG